LGGIREEHDVYAERNQREKVVGRVRREGRNKTTFAVVIFGRKSGAVRGEGG